MTAGFEYFDHTSFGAPILHGGVGRMIALLDWVLVGKGGWTKAYTGTNLAVYRSNTGNRFYLRLDDTQSTYTRTRAYRTMTAVSTGTNQFPNNTQAGNINTWGICKALNSSGSDDPQRYWGIRTNCYLVLVVESVSELDQPNIGLRYRNWFVFGDVPSLCEADSHNSIICAQPNTDSQYLTWYENSMYPTALYPLHSYFTTDAGAAMSGTPNGAVASPLCGVHWPYPGANDGHKASLTQSDRMFFGPLLVGCTNSANTNNGAYPRARIPNVQALYGPAYDGNGAGSDPQMPATDLVPITIGSRQFLPILRHISGVGTYNGVAMLLEMTDTDGAL